MHNPARLFALGLIALLPLVMPSLIRADEVVAKPVAAANTQRLLYICLDKDIAVFDIDVQGGQAIKRKHPEAILVFVLPPSMEELERRLRDRKTDADETIRRRMLAARSEIERGIASYDYIVVNDDFERAFQELRSVVVAERCRRGRVDLSMMKLEKLPSDGAR